MLQKFKFTEENIMYSILIVFVSHPQGGVKQNTSQVVQFSSLEAANLAVTRIEAKNSVLGKYEVTRLY